MTRKILLTSFQTWLPDQSSNSSDDLLAEIAQLDAFSNSLTFLRQLPVDVAQASSLAISKIAELQPDGIICCGMAQSRQKLTVEYCATCGYTSYRVRLYSYCLSICRALGLRQLHKFLQVSFAKSKQPASILIKTSVNLDKLVASLANTDISHDAGKFVCEGLYYQILKYLQEHNREIPCIFVHVPVLTSDNLLDILTDFMAIIEQVTISSNTLNNDAM